MKDTCDICDYCKWVYQVEHDCCDVQIYQCELTGEIIDEFHVERSACEEFISQDWVSG